MVRAVVDYELRKQISPLRKSGITRAQSIAIKYSESTVLDVNGAPQTVTPDEIASDVIIVDNFGLMAFSAPVVFTTATKVLLWAGHENDPAKMINTGLFWDFSTNNRFFDTDRLAAFPFAQLRLDLFEDKDIHIGMVALP